MRSNVLDVLPASVRRGLARFGGDLAVARRKRGLTTAMMAERLAISRTTYARVERGDPTVSLGAYAMALFVLGFGNPLGELVAPAADREGLILDAERLPKRVRPRRTPRPR